MGSIIPENATQYAFDFDALSTQISDDVFQPRIIQTPLRKRCSICKQWHLLASFYGKSAKLNNHHAECKECLKKYHAERRDRLKEAKTGSKQCAICKETKHVSNFWPDYPYCKNCSKARARSYYADNRERESQRSRKSRLKYMYNMTEEDYDAMILKQMGLCAICGKPPKENSILYVDHCHKTGNVRELLCTHCNSAIGHAHESPEILRRAALYVEKHHNIG